MNREIFHEKLTRYKDTVFRIAFSYCKNRSDAEDISQEVFLKYYTTDPDIADEAEEKAWLIRVTINKSKDLLKSSWYSKRCEYEDLHQSYSINEPQFDVLETVLKLPQKYKIVIHLYYFEHYTIKEISEMIGVKVSTLQTRLERGRKLLKKKLKEEEAYEQNIIQCSYGKGYHE